MGALKSYYHGKRVLVTGHTGFKGAWLCEWLFMLGADVVGVSLEPNTTPSLFESLGLADRVEHHILDIRDRTALVHLIHTSQPDVLFHLAAQPLVCYSYEHPVETFSTNVMGTAHVLEGLRHLGKRCEAVIITTDKCYENREQEAPYCEEDRMGGHDPYSASKGAAELVIASYRRSFFSPETYGTEHEIALASARAGNVIGGGDWAANRIVPDCIRKLASGHPVLVRNSLATRPWQHVLEPICGYLTLALYLSNASTRAEREQMCSGFNFGPDPEDNRPVCDLVEQVLRSWPGRWVDETEGHGPHEAGLLNLTIDKAAELLNWHPVWGFEYAVKKTVLWYRAVHVDASVCRSKTQEQILEYSKLLDQNYEI